MKKILLLAFLVVAVLTAVTPAALNAQTHNVTFLVNTATVPDTIKAGAPVQITGGGSKGGDSVLTSWGAGVQLDYVGGDVWSKTLTFADSAAIAYKIRIGANGWENDLSTGNRTLTVLKDTVLPMQYWNNGHIPTGANPDPYATPWTAVADSFINVYFRVNLRAVQDNGSFGWTAADKDSVAVRGDGKGGPDLDWGTSFYLTQEQIPANGSSQFGMPPTSFFSGRLRFRKSQVNEGDVVNFKYLLGSNWGRDELQGGAPNRTFTIPVGKKDTTLQWVYYNNDVPTVRANPDTVVVTFRVNMTTAIQKGSFAIGDTVQVQSGFFQTADSTRTRNLFRQGLTNFYQYTDTIMTALGKPLDYQYYLVKYGNTVRERYFNFQYAGSVGAEQERRQVTASSKTLVVLDTANSVSAARRQPYFANQRKLSQGVAVRWVVDVRPAYYQVWAGDSLRDGQGTAHVTNVDSIKAWGVGINGPATGGPNGPLTTDWATWNREMVADTSQRKMWDDGTHGDLVANDTMYSVIFRYTTNNILGMEFKYGIRGGDNESGFGLNHLENISDTDTLFTLNTQWGSINPNFYSAWDFDNHRPNTTNSVEELSGHALVYALEQNYPNPFNPATKIEFSIPLQSQVQLKIFNILGQEVATLVNENLKAGKHVVSFNANKLASGLYFYKITAGQFVSTKKMLLLK